MKKPHYHLAQVNIARARAPLEDPIMAGFVNQLPVINARPIPALDSSGVCNPRQVITLICVRMTIPRSFSTFRCGSQ